MPTVKEVDVWRAEKAIRDLLKAFNIPARQGMEETPERAVKMLCELWNGELYTNQQLAYLYGKVFPCTSNGLVVVKDIESFSFCEHHLALIYDMKISVGYYPNGKVIGLSKIARIAEKVCHRLQLQERIGQDIYDVMKLILGTDDIAVRIEANHSCMTARGIKKPSSKTVTFTKGGIFDNPTQFKEFLSALNG